MAALPPILDTRVLQDVLLQLQRQARTDLPEWTPSADGDVGTMLQRMFARMMELAIQRLNGVPEKNLFAFLDAMGVTLEPPSAAKVPLVFGLSAGRGPTVVPAGTQAGTKPGGAFPALTFETIEDYTVIPAKLTRAFTVDPVWDRSTDQTAPVSGATGRSFTPFVGTGRLVHALYFGDDLLLNFARADLAIHLTAGPVGMATTDLAAFFDQLTWQYTQGGVNRSLSTTISGTERTTTLQSGAAAGDTALQLVTTAYIQSGDLLLINDAHAETVIVSATPLLGATSVSLTGELVWKHDAHTPVLITTVRFTDVAGPDLTTIQGVSTESSVVHGIQSRYVQAMLTPPLPDIPEDKYVIVSNPEVEVSADLLPDLTFSNQAPQDVTKNFFPFGETPKPGDTLYIGSREAFSKPGVATKLTVQMVIPDAPLLIWEFTTDGVNWSQLPLTTYVVDNTTNLTATGTITIVVPSAAPATGQTWVRTRLLTGSYHQTAPTISQFQLITETTLTAKANAGDLLIIVTQANFAGQGQALVIEQGGNIEVALVSSVNGMTINLSSGLQNTYTPGATVSVPGFFINFAFFAYLSTTAQANSKSVGINLYPGFSTKAGDVLRINDGLNTEFIVVEGFTPISVASGAQITSASPLLYTHAAGTFVDGPLQPQASPPLNFLAQADQNWINLAAFQAVTGTPPNTFQPLGGNPSVSDVFSFRTSGGYNYPTPPAVGQIGNFPQIILNLNVEVSLQSLPVNLAWEYLSSAGWEQITPRNDPTDSFLAASSHSLAITLPPVYCALAEVNGQKNYWIRVRIASGNYGLPAEYIPVDPNNPQKGYQVKPGTGNLNAPQLTMLEISYDAERSPVALITQNGFLYSDKSNSQSNIVPFIAVTDLAAPYSDPEPAFYLGCDASFPQQPVKLWIDATAQSFSGGVLHESSMAPGLLPQLPTLRWEYFNGTGWARLAVLDATNNLTESGTIDFLTPEDFATLAKFDLTPLYWIRARSSYNFPPDSQQLDGVYLNAVPAVQAVTIGNEIVGSSNARPGQSFALKSPPVLAGQSIWVHEPEAPSDSELAAIQSGEGLDAVQSRTNSITGAAETWVRWHEVPGFLISGIGSRHYTLDHSTGTLQFGDGQNGMIPPAGLNDISATYQSGGGAAGNLPPAAIVQVKSAVPGVISVSNPVAADGGAAAETSSSVKLRGPQVMRNRGFAVSAGDFEWLAMEADGSRVARARCLPNVNKDLAFEPGWVTLMIVPNGTDARLAPDSELVTQVENYLVSRSFIGLADETPARINVIGPGYIQVAVVAEVVPVDLESAQSVKQNVVAALNNYFHPLTGGHLGTGWEFGRDVYASEVSTIIQDVAGVDHLKTLDLVPNIAQSLVYFANNPFHALPTAGSLRTVIPGKAALIAGTYHGDSAGLPIKGFKEGDRFSRVLDLRVESADATGTILTVNSVEGDPIKDAVGFRSGSLVMTFDGAASVQLASAILPGEPVSTITIQTPFPDGVSLDIITVFYPFSMTATGVSVGSISVTVVSVGAAGNNVITVGPFSTVETGLPAGTVVTTVGGTRMTQLTAAIAPNQTGITTLQVADSSFVAALEPGDVLFLQLSSQTLSIVPYQPEIAFPAGSVLARLDNLVRLPLLRDLPAGASSTQVVLADFALNDSVKVFDSAATAGAAPSPVTISKIQPIADIVYMDDNFLVYAGQHQITMVEK